MKFHILLRRYSMKTRLLLDELMFLAAFRDSVVCNRPCMQALRLPIFRYSVFRSTFFQPSHKEILGGVCGNDSSFFLYV